MKLPLGRLQARLHGHLPSHLHDHLHDPNAFQGKATHYNRLTGLVPWLYRRIARDIAATAGPNASILDVGTGPGRLLVELARIRPDLNLTGLDPATDMVETAKRQLAEFGDRATAVVGDAADLPFGDDSFDVVISSLSLHHWADAGAGGAELTRVLRDGGQVRIYDMPFAPFADLTTGTGVTSAAPPERFRLTPLPLPALRRLVLRPS